MLLNERGDIYRMLEGAKAGRKELLPWKRAVPCHVEPVSAIGQNMAYAVQSTHVVTIPHWIEGLRIEDEIHVGYRATVDGRQARNFVIKGLQPFTTFGLRHLAAYCTERV